MSLSEKKETSKTVEDAKASFDILGDWGLWQTNIAAFCTSVAVFSAFNCLTGTFYQPATKFECQDVQFVQYRNVSNATHNECELPTGYKCQSWLYMGSQMNRTAVTEFNWVCDSSWLGSFSTTILMAGVMAAAFIFGIASDLMGRKKCAIVAFVIEIAAGLLSAFAPTSTVFLISRGLLGFGSYGRGISGFTIAIETTGTKYRAVLGVAVQLGWALGTILMPPIAYYTQDYKLFILITTLPEFIWFLWMIIIIPESPRWLLGRKKYDEARIVYLEAARMNGMNLDQVNARFDCLIANLKDEDKSVPENTSVFSDLWQSKQLIVYTLVFYLLWFTNAFVYYGFTLNVNDLGGNLFWDAFWSGLIEFPAYLICMRLFKYVGRRPLLIGTMAGAGLASLAVVPFYTFVPMVHTLVDIFAFSGKFFVTMSFALIYVYSAEVYPTVLRQVGVGSCSVIARLGTFISPFMKEMTAATNLGVSMSIYAVFALMSAAAATFLPETKDKEIPSRVRDLKDLRDKSIGSDLKSVKEQRR